MSAEALPSWSWLEPLRMTALAPPAPDEALPILERAQKGDRRAFDELYRRYATEVHRRISRLIGPDPEREDLVQQVFIDVFRGLSGFRRESAFSTWLYRIVVNVSFEHLRKRRRRPAEVVALELVERIDDRASPEEAARRREELLRGLALLERLDPKKRIAFVLRVVEGLSLDEIGAIVGAKAPAVGMRVKHAQRELAELIAKQEKREQRPGRSA
ncbi:MAG: sigma-70 family RNA polymerase sigma factor [Myxococcota bacterium]